MNLLLQIGDVVVDTRAAQVHRSGRPMVLEPRTYDLLLYFLTRPGQLLGHRELLERVWHGAHVTSHSLTQAISQLRQTLGDDPIHPRFVETVHRRGYRWLAPIQDLPGDPLPPQTQASVALASQDLPTPVAPLLGRTALIDEIVAALGTSRMVALTGPGGIGKTQVALEAGREARPRFKDGALFLDLTHEFTEEGVVRALAQALGIDPARVPALEALCAKLRGQELLLLLDNCEQAALAIASVALSLLRSNPGLRILATTQRRIPIQGQEVIQIPPLAVPERSWAALDLDPATWPESVQLFLRRAREVQPGLDPGPGQIGTIADICRRLEGIPLAIELSAARCNVMAPEQIAEQLGERILVPCSTTGESSDRHSTLEATLAWSVGLLSGTSQRFLEALATFHGGWPLDGAEAVTDGGEETMDRLAGLVDRSLVLVESHAGVSRFHLLEPIRLFLKDRLAISPGYLAVRDRHLRWVEQLSSLADQEICKHPSMWLRRIQVEGANFREALDWAASDASRAEVGLRICCNLRWAWRYSGDYIDSQAFLTRALATATTAPPDLAARARINLGLILQHRGAFGPARDEIQRGLTDLSPDSRWDRAFGLLNLAFLETMGGSLDRGDDLALEADPLLSGLDDVRLHGIAQVRKGLSAGIRGRHQDAVQFLRQILDQLEGREDVFLLAFAKVQLALQNFLIEDPEAATAMAIDSIQDGLFLDNPRMSAGGIEVLGYCAAQAGDDPVAARLLGHAAHLREMTGAPILRNFEPTHHQVQAQLETRMGLQEFQVLFDAGTTTSIQEILGEILNRRGRQLDDRLARHNP